MYISVYSFYSISYRFNYSVYFSLLLLFFTILLSFCCPCLWDNKSSLILILKMNATQLRPPSEDRCQAAVCSPLHQTHWLSSCGLTETIWLVLWSSPAQTFDTRRSSGQTLQSESLHRVRTLWQPSLGVHRHLSVVSRCPGHHWRQRREVMVVHRAEQTELWVEKTQ